MAVTNPEPLHQSAATGADRRVAERHPGRRVTSCRMIALPQNIPVRVVVRDVSMSGIGLISEQPIAPDSFLAIELQGARDLRLLLRARVVHATMNPDRSWLLGCVLLKELKREELEALM